MAVALEVWLVFCFEFSKKARQRDRKLHGHHAHG